MLRKTFFTGLITLITLSGLCQVTGYMGKRVILKTTVINGIRRGFNGAEIEYVAGRRVSVTGSFQKFNYSRSAEGITLATGKINPRDGRCSLSEKTTLSNGNTKGWFSVLGARYYFNRILPSPIGFYTEVNVGIGRAELSGYNVGYAYSKTSVLCDYDEVLPLDRKIEGLGGTAGVFLLEAPAIGYQKVIGRFIVIDLKASLLSQYAKLPENLSETLEHNYYLRSNMFGLVWGPVSSGLNIFARIGILLF
jgi:hypothetical protein